MRKFYLRYSKNIEAYWTFSDYKSPNFDLRNLWLSFDYTNEWIDIDEEDSGWVDIWNILDLKDKKWRNFISLEEQKKYDEAYSQYNKKRWDDMPILRITKQNYEQVLREWEKLKKSKASYGIISIDDAGWVRIEGKNKLDQQDLQDLKEEHQKYLNYKEKWDAYKPFAWKKNKEWESKADSEYYSDYLTEEEMVWKKKSF